MIDVVVIGGGAAGLAAAIAAASNGKTVCVFEASDRVGSKIMATGNGRCNLTNMLLTADDYNHPEFVAPTLEKMGPKQLCAWFAQQGLLTAEEREGRMYPLSNTANSVLDVLRVSCERVGVKFVTNMKVERISLATATRPTSAVLSDGSEVVAHRILVACGGGSRLLESCGHTIVPEQPVLCAVSTDTEPIRGLSGIRLRCGVQLLEEGDASPVFSEEGELLFRDYGVSGIVAFNASRFVKPGQTMRIDLLPSMSFVEIAAMMSERVRWAQTYEQLLCGVFHPQVNRAVLRRARCKLSAAPDAMGTQRLARLIKAFDLDVKGPGDVKHAQVTRGGACVDEFDPHTLESKLVRGVYGCGECLDIDGPCGGYNLHWAWASGIIASSR